MAQKGRFHAENCGLLLRGEFQTRERVKQKGTVILLCGEFLLLFVFLVCIFRLEHVGRESEMVHRKVPDFVLECLRLFDYNKSFSNL